MSEKRINIQEVSHIYFRDLVFDNNNKRLFISLFMFNLLIPLSLAAIVVSITNLNIIWMKYNNNSFFAISFLIQIFWLVIFDVIFSISFISPIFRGWSFFNENKLNDNKLFEKKTNLYFTILLTIIPLIGVILFYWIVKHLINKSKQISIIKLNEKQNNEYQKTKFIIKSLNNSLLINYALLLFSLSLFMTLSWELQKNINEINSYLLIFLYVFIINLIVFIISGLINRKIILNADLDTKDVLKKNQQNVYGNWCLILGQFAVIQFVNILYKEIYKREIIYITKYNHKELEKSLLEKRKIKLLRSSSNKINLEELLENKPFFKFLEIDVLIYYQKLNDHNYEVEYIDNQNEYPNISQLNDDLKLLKFLGTDYFTSGQFNKKHKKTENNLNNQQISPFLNQYGADALRIGLICNNYQIEHINHQKLNEINGWLEKVWIKYHLLIDSGWLIDKYLEDDEMKGIYEETIEKIRPEMENKNYHEAINILKNYFNVLEKNDKIKQSKYISDFLIMLLPFAPFLVLRLYKIEFVKWPNNWLK